MQPKKLFNQKDFNLKRNFDIRNIDSKIRGSKINLNIRNINPEGPFFKKITGKINQHKEQLNEMQKNQILGHWNEFLKSKNVNQKLREKIISSYLNQMKKEGKNVLTAPSIETAWLGGGVYGSVLRIGGRAIKFENYDGSEETSLKTFNKIKKQNFDQVQNYIGTHNKAINHINASKHMNTPTEIVTNHVGGVMISQYEEAKCDFSELSSKQRNFQNSRDNDWIYMQELIIGNFVTQTLKALAKIHSSNEAHGDLHMGNILVSTRISSKSGTKKINFMLHDRSYKSAFLWLEQMLNGKTPTFNEHLFITNKNKVTIKNEIKYINDYNLYKNRNLVNKWMYYLKLVDLNLLSLDIDGYLEDTGLGWNTRSPNSVFQILGYCWKDLNNSENALQVLASKNVTNLRDTVNKINNSDCKLYIDSILK